MEALIKSSLSYNYIKTYNCIVLREGMVRIINIIAILYLMTIFLQNCQVSNSNNNKATICDMPNAGCCTEGIAGEKIEEKRSSKTQARGQ